MSSDDDENSSASSLVGSENEEVNILSDDDEQENIKSKNKKQANDDDEEEDGETEDEEEEEEEEDDDDEQEEDEEEDDLDDHDSEPSSVSSPPTKNSRSISPSKKSKNILIAEEEDEDEDDDEQDDDESDQDGNDEDEDVDVEQEEEDEDAPADTDEELEEEVAEEEEVDIEDEDEDDEEDELEDEDDEDFIVSSRASRNKSALPTKLSFASTTSRTNRRSSPTKSNNSSTTRNNNQNRNGSGNKNKKQFKNGIKPVPFDPVFIPPGDKSSIEKMLSWRQDGIGEIYILVKYKNMSYNSIEWLPKSQVEEELKQGKTRIKRFLDKPLYETHWSDDEPFNPSFTKVDRVIDEGELDGKVHYLVKWTSLPYDECTWEPDHVLEELDPEKAEEFHQRRAPTDEKVKSYKIRSIERPDIKNWHKMEESPIYKNENELRSYQLEGLNWLMFCWYQYQNCILADEMGLGKTVQSTAFLKHLYTKMNIKGPFLIITPLSTLGNWEREIKTWTDMNLIVYHGRDTARNLIVDTEFYYKDADSVIDASMYKYDIILTTYEMAMAGLSQLKPIQWRCCVLDEAHRLKNKSSKISETLKQYSFEHIVLLTGTPLQNSLEELWSLLNFLDAETFRDEKTFQREYANLTTAADVEKLQMLLKPLMLRRLKEDVEKTIPVKEETIVEVELTTIQKKWYRSILERNFSWIKQGSKRNNVPNLINTMMELRKCCIHPFLLRGAEEAICDEYKAISPEQHFQVMIQACGKMVLIDKLLRKLKAGGHKVLLFSQMTKCLDIIQDYLRGRGYSYERIDGSIRGDLRQAAIDRFCDPNSDSFVFLLCTRAGGVGINLTVADTVIIYDSDWNPQNDLQAQARCHRIGQTKSVQIYRLVTRSTYEKDMLDRASMKLGLDKAILQRMDAQSAYDFSQDSSSGAPSSLSKQEVEELLKKGAYGAFMDDEASKEFCEEDIDKILQRRSHVIRHDNTAEKGSIFSKATFATSTQDNIDINDPDFWDKVAEKAQFEIVEEEFENQHLILTEPRMRKQVQRFGLNEDREDSEIESEDEDAKKSKSADEPKPWSVTEKTRFERNLMLFGFGAWDKMIDSFSRRTVKDLRAVGRSIVKRCMASGNAVEQDIMKDIEFIMEAEFTLLREEYGHDTLFDDAVPYPDATEKQISEYRSFLIDTSAEYQEHIDKKAKSLLTRIQMLHTIRERIRPDEDIIIPIIPGNAPTSWWGPAEDKDLLRGVLRHGYGQYDKTREDPELCFYPRFHDAEGHLLLDENDDQDLGSIASLEPTQNGDDQDTQTDNGRLEGSDTKSLVEKNIKEESSQDTQEDERVEEKKSKENKKSNKGKDEDEDNLSADEIDVVTTQNELNDDDKNKDANDDEDSQEHVWPGPADLGIRIRKVIAAFIRQLNATAREVARRMQLLEKQKAKLERDQERMKAREKEFTRKDRLEFMKTLMSFGIETDPDDRSNRIWTRFREISGLKKSDETIDEYFLRVVSLAKEAIDKGDEEQARIAKENDSNKNVDRADTPQPMVLDDGNEEKEEDENGDIKQEDNKSKFNAYTFKVERDGDSLTYDKAKRLERRLDRLKVLREQVLVHPQLDDLLSNGRRGSKYGLPSWWDQNHDKSFLIGISRWGIQRSDLIIQDTTLPFHKIHEEFKEQEGAEEEKFWMKENTAVKRFEFLIESVLNPPRRSTPNERKQKAVAKCKKGSAGNELDQMSGSEMDRMHPMKIKLKYVQDPSQTPLVASTSNLSETPSGVLIDLPKSSKKKRRKTLDLPKPPDVNNENVTLEELLSFDKRIKALYFSEYNQYKRSAMKERHKYVIPEGVHASSLIPPINTVSKKSAGPKIERSKPKPTPPPQVVTTAPASVKEEIIEYSENSDGEMVVSSVVINGKTPNGESFISTVIPPKITVASSLPSSPFKSESPIKSRGGAVNSPPKNQPLENGISEIQISAPTSPSKSPSKSESRRKNSATSHRGSPIKPDFNSIADDLPKKRPFPSEEEVPNGTENSIFIDDDHSKRTRVSE